MRLLLHLRLLLCLPVVMAPSIGCTQTTMDDPLEPIRKQILAQIEKGELASVSIGVSKGGEVLYMESFGWANKKAKRRATAETIYPLGSLSKSITATGLMHLIQEERITLQDEVNRFLPGKGLQSFVGDSKAVKVWHILNMAAGIPHGWATSHLKFGYPKTIEEKSDFLKKVGIVTFPPGKVSHYSNYSYGIAELLIEGASGRTLTDFMTNAIFQPLDMKQSLVRYDEGRAAELAALYDQEGREIAPYHFLPVGGAGFFGSVTDLLKYGGFHLKLESSKAPNVLNDKYLDLMHNFNEGPMPYFGFGWLNTGHSLISNGSINGANSNITLVPSEELVIVCLMNSTSMSSLADQLSDQIMNALLPNLEKKLDMTFFMENFQTPYQPKDGLIGEWEGFVQTDQGSTPIALQFTTGGEIWLTIDRQSPTELSNKTLLPSGKFEAMGQGTLAVPEFSSTDPVSIAIALQWDGDQLYGHFAPRFSTTQGGRCYGVFARLTKVSP